jgi:hypothetical protein
MSQRQAKTRPAPMYETPTLSTCNPDQVQSGSTPPMLYLQSSQRRPSSLVISMPPSSPELTQKGPNPAAPVGWFPLTLGDAKSEE